MSFHEILGYLAAFLTTASFLPQVYKSWKTKSTEGLSLTMYTVFFIGILCWLVYGIYLNSMPIILANTITGICAFILIVLKIRYK
ncbi:SemiSWEET family sugar transporter [Tenacibaculum agarivorans]|uniref:SemiSWEET family sugar transporter n=1 Tax=Tenacibaculum agarivorans TaxID=1908389 RepID=UPI00094B7C84|nr:SemiSWEET transporter [Tenacibaculum agarivorans]